MPVNLSAYSKIVERHGFMTFLIYICRRLFLGGTTKDSCRIFLYILDTPKPSISSIAAASKHIFRFATEEDIRRIHENPEWHEQATWNTLDGDLKALSRGDRCLMQLDGEDLVGYAWISASSLVEIMWGYHYNMTNHMVYNYKAFTVPSYRGNSFQPLRHLKLIDYIKNEGKTCLFGYVDQLNLNSIKGVSKSGYKKIGVLRCARKGDKINFNLKVLGRYLSNNARV